MEWRGVTPLSPSGRSRQTMKQLDGQRSPLLQLNAELLQATVLQHLDGRSLAALECTCRAFRALAPRGLRITEAAAREQLVRRCRGILQEAERWRCGPVTSGPRADASMLCSRTTVILATPSYRVRCAAWPRTAVTHTSVHEWRPIVWAPSCWPSLPR